MSKLIIPKTTEAFLENKTPIAGEILAVKNSDDPLHYGDGATVAGLILATMADNDPYVYGVDFALKKPNTESDSYLHGDRVILNNRHDLEGDPARYTVVDSFMRLPCHEFKRCVMMDPVTRTVAYYLNPTDSSLKESGDAADLTGGDGDVMVEIPVSNYRIDTYRDADGYEHLVYLVSAQVFSGSAVHPCFYISHGGSTIRKQYIGAFRSVQCNLDGTVNAEEAPAANTFMFRSIAGVKPTFGSSLGTHTAGDRAHGYQPVSELLYEYLGMMFMIEYASSNTSELSWGLHMIAKQNLAVIRNTGRTSVFGNASGAIAADDTGLDKDIMDLGADGWKHPDQPRDVQMSYRGIEDLWGTGYTLMHGAVAYISNTGIDDLSTNGIWYTTDLDKYDELITKVAPGEESGYGLVGPKCHWTFIPFIKHRIGFTADFDPNTFFALSLNAATPCLNAAWYSYSSDIGQRVIVRSPTYISGDRGGLFWTAITHSYASNSNHATGRISC